MSPFDEVTVTIGGLPIQIRCRSPEFIELLQQRYATFIGGPWLGAAMQHPSSAPTILVTLEVQLIQPRSSNGNADDDLAVTFENNCWVMRREDFLAQWNPQTGCGLVRQAAYPYAIDSVMRIIHSLVLARSGGFLLHAASAIRRGRAYLFTGVSGAGKTTIARLAPPDTMLLTDEISYVRLIGTEYYAFGTPFAGELGIPGEDVAAPVAAIYFLHKGPDNEVAAINGEHYIGPLLRNVLFFAQDPTLVQQLFDTVCAFAAQVPFYELLFEPKPEVWELIG